MRAISRFFATLAFTSVVFTAQATFAQDNIHQHPNAEPVSQAKGKITYPGYCEIELVNNSNQAVLVTGRFDDGSYLDPFWIYPYEYPHTISLYYYGYCHSGMDIFVDENAYSRIFAGYVPVYSTVNIYPMYKSAQVNISAKPPVQK